MKSILRRRAVMALVLSASSFCREVLAADESEPSTASVGASRPPGDPRPELTAAWMIMQAVPSPGIGIGDEGAHLSLEWQITPVSLSWGVDSRLSPFRFFIVEPSYRTSGSIEWFLAPGYLGRGPGVERWGGATGLRSYFPLLARGEHLALSLGAGGHFSVDDVGPFFEAGVHTLFGMTGLTVRVAPWFDRNLVQVNMRVRWF